MSTANSRIGSVPYLNARPLIFGIEQEVKLIVPSLLSAELRKGNLDIALIPVAEYLDHPQYQIMPGMAIGSRGRVNSVYLAYRSSLSQLRNVILDPSSKTSNLLLRVLLAEYFDLKLVYKTEGVLSETNAQLLIGDPALLARDRLLKEGCQLLDLGEVWHEKTGLPFVFAFWALRKDVPGSAYLQTLTAAKTNGLKNLDQIVAAEKSFPPDVVHEYLTHHIRYDLGTEEIKGLIEFQRLSLKHGLITQKSEFVFYQC